LFNFSPGVTPGAFFALISYFSIMNQDCLDQIRTMYQLYTGADIADAIKIVRAEMTAEEDRHALQVEILAKQAALEKLTHIK
jgi:hypothetical protein